MVDWLLHLQGKKPLMMKRDKKNDYRIWDFEAGHLLEDAEKWWESIGKEMMKARSFSDSYAEQQDALNATNPIHPNYLGGKSGILLGVSWDLLTKAERYQVLKIYTITMKKIIHDSNNKYNTSGSIIS